MKEIYKLALMDMACRFGETSFATRLKVGSLIYKNGSVISLGCNGQPPGWETEVCEDENGNTLPTVSLVANEVSPNLQAMSIKASL